jgi:predicted membrane protein
LNNLGILPWNIWFTLFRFWPIFIIIAGVNIILGKGLVQEIIKVIIYLSTLSALILYSILTINSTQDIKINFPFQVNIPKVTQEKSEEKTFVINAENDIEQTSYIYNSTAGVIDISDSSSQKETLKGTVKYHPNTETPTVTSEKTDKTQKVNFKMDFNQTNFWGNFEENSYSFIQGNTNLPTNTDLTISAGKATINLDESAIEKFTIKMSAGDLKIELGANSLPKDSLDLELSAGNAKIILPKDANYKIAYSVSAGSLKFNGKAVNEGLSDEGTFKVGTQSSAYYIININESAGNIEIETK